MAEAESTSLLPQPGSPVPARGALPTVSTTGASENPWRFIFFWAMSWAIVGLVVGMVIAVAMASFSRSPLRLGDAWPVLELSVMFAEVIGLTALSSSRLVFPYYASLPYLPRLLLQIATVGGGSFFGTLVVSLMRPLFALHNLSLILSMVLVNASLALVVSIAVNTYENMKRQLERTYVELRKKEAFDREMEIAREVQEQLLPKSVPSIRGIELAGICRPAAGVGGDYYDYIPLSENRVGLVIADVSGKGISAALLMASLQASVRSVIAPDTNPSAANGRLNDIIFHSTSASRYATLFLGLFDGADRTIRYSNAGHNPPLAVGRSGAQKLSEGGLPLGILKGARYLEGRHSLEPGDILFLYTDGAVEAADPSGEEFGLDRLAALLEQQRTRGDLHEIIEMMLMELREWTHGASQQDDITIVLARAAGSR